MAGKWCELLLLLLFLSIQGKLYNCFLFLGVELFCLCDVVCGGGNSK